MHIVDAIKALKGGLEAEKESHMTTMNERDQARESLQPETEARQAAEARAIAAEAIIAEAAEALGIEAVEAEAPVKAKAGK